MAKKSVDGSNSCVEIMPNQHDDRSLWPFIRSQRGAPLILHSNFVYRCERKIQSKTYWLCIRYKRDKCNGRLIIKGNRITKETTHSHDVDERANDKNVELKSLEDDDLDNWLLINQIDAPRRRRLKKDIDEDSSC